MNMSTTTLLTGRGLVESPRWHDGRLYFSDWSAGEVLAVGLEGRSPLRSVEPGAPPAPARAYGNFVERFEAAYRAELAAFVDAVRSGGGSPCTLDEARAALLVALAADRSREERRPVRIEEVASAEALTR